MQPVDLAALEGRVQACDERIALGTREYSVAYGEGIGTSKLKLPDPGGRTARNRNSVEKIAALLETMA